MTRQIECTDATVAYEIQGKLVYALKNINFSVSQGEWIALVGRNGSGKSTLGQVIAGLCPLSKGRIVKTIAVNEAKEANATNCGGSDIALVFQNPNAQIVGQTVLEDILFGLENHGCPPEDMPSRAEEALRVVGLSHKIHAEVETLSGGQKQLLCVASAIALRPAVLVFDEATSMLSPQARKTILNVVRQLQESGTTILWITQWMDELPHASRVVALENGCMVYDGDVHRFFYSTDASPNTGWAPCEALGFDLPFVVQAVRRLTRENKALAKKSVSEWPLTAEQLGQFLVCV